LLLTRVYNVRSTTIFCVTSVTSVTRRLLYTTTTYRQWYSFSRTALTAELATV